MLANASANRGEVPHFQLDIVTTTAGVITMLLTIDEAVAVVESSLATNAPLRELVGSSPAAGALRADRSVLRAALIVAYGEFLGSNDSLTGHDEEGASWAIRTGEIVAIRVADPDLTPQPPTARQIGFAQPQRD